MMLLDLLQCQENLLLLIHYHYHDTT